MLGDFYVAKRSWRNLYVLPNGSGWAPDGIAKTGRCGTRAFSLALRQV